MLSECGAGESLDCKEIKSVHPKGNQSWIFIGNTDAEAETPNLWPPDEKSWLIGKDPDAGKDWRREGEGDDRGWDGWMAMTLSKLWEMIKDREAWCAVVHGVVKSRTRLSSWTELETKDEVWVLTLPSLKWMNTSYRYKMYLDSQTWVQSHTIICQLYELRQVS